MPFVERTQQLDYSLQVARGIANFRAWVLASYPDNVASTTDVPAYDFKPSPLSPTPALPAALGVPEPALPFEEMRQFTR